MIMFATGRRGLSQCAGTTRAGVRCQRHAYVLELGRDIFRCFQHRARS